MKAENMASVKSRTGQVHMVLRESQLRKEYLAACAWYGMQ
jgi:hypothetical protein